jgi:hypothetical protein
MHYRDLYIAHKAYYYDWYVKRKNWEKWTSSVPLDEKRAHSLTIHH